MKHLRFLVVFTMVLMGSRAVPAQAPQQHIPASSIPVADLIQPEDLAAQLKETSAERPLILQVGSHVMFAQAHIPGSEYAGPAGKEDSLQVLKQRVADLPKNTTVVLYCGCCPWDRCPNIAPAYRLLHEQRFTNLKVLYIAENFGTNWVDKGYPADKGQ